MFSSRIPPDREPNRLAATVARLREAGTPILDLTASNPTTAGLSYPSELTTLLGDPRGGCYEPSPLGLPRARAAVSRELERTGQPVPPGRVVLTTSTSEAYSLLFKLLCNPGDTVFVPRPSYPLFEHLASLDGVTVESYPLEYHGRWSIDREHLARALASSRTPARAILIVSPNNPTGSYLQGDELVDLVELCRTFTLALISDEVFADYPIDPAPGRAPGVTDQDIALAFALGGLSKSAGLPQMKLGWIGVGGPEALAREAIDRLEFLCDMYLSVGTPVQQAAERLLALAPLVRVQIGSRVVANYRWLVTAAERYPSCRVLRAEGGWYAVVHIPAVVPEETLVQVLLEQDLVLVHPGYFFDFPREAYLVISLLPRPETFAEGVERVFRRVAGF